MKHYFISTGTNTCKNKLRGLYGDCGASYFPNKALPGI